MTQLPRRQKQLYDILVGRGEVAVLDIYRAMNPSDADHRDDPRWAHQWLGIYVSRANRKLAERGLRIQPGERKLTYTLAVVE